MSGKRTKAAGPQPAPVEVPSRLVRPLGIEGWDDLESVVLAALAAEDPLLLVGPHGSAKSLLLERIAAALGLVFRGYNASLLHFDDLVGVPLPDETGRALRYIATPTSIWDAEIVFLDELNRTRPDLQNKVFPIVHERRVQGMALERLRHRWAAMNPPMSDPGGGGGGDYLGAEPLDPALADRFPFLVEAPGWRALSPAGQRRVLLGSQQAAAPAPESLRSLVADARRLFLVLRQAWPARLADHFVLLEEKRLAAAAPPHSTRRMAMLLRNTLSIQAARAALAGADGDRAAVQGVDWETSAWLAFLHGCPELAERGTLDRVLMRGHHRHAWSLCGLDADDPWRELLALGNPLDRLVRAVHLGPVVGEESLGHLVLDGVESAGPDGHKVAVALAAYLALLHARSLPAIVVESLAHRIAPVLQPAQRTLDLNAARATLAREVGSLHAESTPGTPLVAHTRNLLEALLPDGYAGTTPRAVRDLFVGLCERLGLGAATEVAA